MVAAPEIVRGTTWHGRFGAVRHAFRYRMDFLLLDPEAHTAAPLFRRNALAVASVHDRDHGGSPGAGEGAPGPAVRWPPPACPAAAGFCS